MRHLIVSIYDNGYALNVTIIDNKKVSDYYPNDKLNIATSLYNKCRKYTFNQFMIYLRSTYGDEFDTITIIDNASTTVVKGDVQSEEEN